MVRNYMFFRAASLLHFYGVTPVYSQVSPIKAKGDAPDALIAFMQDVGIPLALHSDDAREQSLDQTYTK